MLRLAARRCLPLRRQTLRITRRSSRFAIGRNFAATRYALIRNWRTPRALSEHAAPVSWRAPWRSRSFSGPARSLEKQPIEPRHQNVNLCHVGIKKPGRDSRTKRPARGLLPCEPRMDDRLWLRERGEALFSNGNPCHAGFDVGEKATARRHQKTKEIFEDAARLIVRHDPDTEPRQGSGRRWI